MVDLLQMRSDCSSMITMTVLVHVETDLDRFSRDYSMTNRVGRDDEVFEIPVKYCQLNFIRSITTLSLVLHFHLCSEFDCFSV